MYQYRQIIFRLRSGDTIRSIARAKLADRKKVRSIRQIAIQQGWLNPQHELPTDEILAKFFGQREITTTKNHYPLITPYQSQVREWHQQGIQATTIHAFLKRQHGYTGGYNTVQRLIKHLKNQSAEVTTILEFKPAECAQVDFGSGPPLVNTMTGEITKTWIFVMVLAWSRHRGRAAGSCRRRARRAPRPAWTRSPG